MYSEKSFKNYIFWLQVKRVFIIILLSIIGALLGILIGKILQTALQNSTYNNYIIIALTIFFFAMALLLTTGTGKDVQDAYWKIAVLRKLTVIQKDIELNNDLLSGGKKSVSKVNNSEEMGLVKVDRPKRKIVKRPEKAI